MSGTPRACSAHPPALPDQAFLLASSANAFLDVPSTKHSLLEDRLNARPQVPAVKPMQHDARCCGPDVRQVNYGMGAANPLDKVRFFEHWPDTSSFHIDSATQNSMMPQAYQVRRFSTQKSVQVRLSKRVVLGPRSWLPDAASYMHQHPSCQVDDSGHAAEAPLHEWWMVNMWPPFTLQ